MWFRKSSKAGGASSVKHWTEQAIKSVLESDEVDLYVDHAFLSATYGLDDEAQGWFQWRSEKIQDGQSPHVDAVDQCLPKAQDTSISLAGRELVTKHRHQGMIFAVEDSELTDQLAEHNGIGYLVFSKGVSTGEPIIAWRIFVGSELVAQDLLGSLFQLRAQHVRPIIKLKLLDVVKARQSAVDAAKAIKFPLAAFRFGCTVDFSQADTEMDFVF
jgi:hypothetical protein